MAKKTYRLCGTDLIRDGERYPEGSTITLDEAEAARHGRVLELVSKTAKTTDDSDDKRNEEDSGIGTDTPPDNSTEKGSTP